MTTIAWDGRTLAADRQRTHGDSRQTVCKLHDCGEYLYASCGDLPDGRVVAKWLREGAEWDKRPVLDEAGCVGLAIRKADGAVIVVEGKVVTLCEVPPGPTATGSGKDYALAAMACGKTAREAVEIASLFDIYSGLGVDAVDVVAAAQGGREAAERHRRRPRQARPRAAAEARVVRNGHRRQRAVPGVRRGSVGVG